MHVPLRRAEMLMPRELLDRARRGAAHREVRAEGVTQTVDAARATPGNPCASYRPLDMVARDVPGERRSVAVTWSEHARRCQPPSSGLDSASRTTSELIFSRAGGAVADI